ncbi:hypothetical protein HPP92_018364 [Vanilla planifolia]|uniref:Uncharacterized protein n=1 Tax=Vanilla planifolia TaxID=51239 RepID=A0A835QDY6_VANPL|nr:hypothetical protein HPP92_018364 [Vanilla planifolia]
MICVHLISRKAIVKVHPSGSRHKGRNIPARASSSFYNLRMPPLPLLPSRGPGHPLLQQSQAMGVVWNHWSLGRSVAKAYNAPHKVNWVNNFFETTKLSQKASSFETTNLLVLNVGISAVKSHP